MICNYNYSLTLETVQFVVKYNTLYIHMQAKREHVNQAKYFVYFGE